MGLVSGRCLRPLARAAADVSDLTSERSRICYLIHGASYVIFSQMEHFWAALVFIALSRAAVAVSSVLNMTQLC